MHSLTCTNYWSTDNGVGERMVYLLNLMKLDLELAEFEKIRLRPNWDSIVDYIKAHAEKLHEYQMLIPYLQELNTSFNIVESLDTLIMNHWKNASSYGLTTNSTANDVCNVFIIKQTLLFDGYFRLNVLSQTNDGVYIPCVIINLCRQFFVVDIHRCSAIDQSLQIDDAIKRFTGESLFKFAANCCCNSNEYWIASQILLYSVNSTFVSISVCYEALGVVFKNWGEFELADQAFRTSLEMDPYSHICRYNYALLLCRQNKYDLSLKMCFEACELAPNRSHYLRHAGHCYFYLQNYEKAEEFHLKAFELDSTNGAHCIDLAFLMMKLNRFEAADQYIETAKTLNSSNKTQDAKIAQYYSELGLHFVKRECRICYDDFGHSYEWMDLPRSAKAFKNALKFQPESDVYLNNYASSLYAKKKYDLSVKLYIKACELNPKDYRFRRIGDCYVALRNYETAEKFYNKALELGPHDAINYLRIARLFYKKEEFRKANRCIEKAEQLNGMDGRQNFELAKYFRDYKRDYRKAEMYYKSCLGIKKTTCFRVSYGYCLYLMKQYDEARRYLEFSCDGKEENFDPCWPYFYYGLLEYDSGNMKMADYYLNQFVTFSTNDSSLMDDLEIIKVQDPKNICYIRKCRKILSRNFNELSLLGH